MTHINVTETLNNIISLGWFKHKTGKEVNIKKGRTDSRAHECYFYLNNGSRILITKQEKFEDWVKVTEPLF